MMARAKKLTKDLLRASTGRLGDTFCSPSTKLVIFSRGRTGSTCLSRCSDRIHRSGTITRSSESTYLQQDFIRNEVNKLGAVAYFERVLQRMFIERVVGVKFLYFHLEPEWARQWNVPDVPTLLPVLRERRDLRIIHLKRRNHLATLVSWKVAHCTQRWQRHEHGRLAHRDSLYRNITVKLTYEECREEFAKTEQWQQFYDQAFTSHPFLEMYYEDLVAYRRREMTRTLEFLDLKDRDLQSSLGHGRPTEHVEGCSRILSELA